MHSLMRSRKKKGRGRRRGKGRRGRRKGRRKGKGTKKKECKSKTFLLRKERVKTVFMQRMKVQEIDSEGRTPRQVIC